MSRSEESFIDRCPHDRENPYSIINTDLIRNPNISTGARWFLIYLLSHDKSFSISIPSIIRTQKISKNKIYNIINECIEIGHIKRETYKENGMKRYRYRVSELPKFKECLPCPQNQDTEKQDPENEDSKYYQSSSSLRSEEVKKYQSKEDAGVSPPHPDLGQAEAMSEYFFESIKQKKENFNPPERKKWASSFVGMMKDGRSLESIKYVIDHIVEDENLLPYLMNPKSIRKRFDEIEMKAHSRGIRSRINENRNYLIALKQSCPEINKMVRFDDKYVINIQNGKEIPFNLPIKTFKETLEHVLGGEIVER